MPTPGHSNSAPPDADGTDLWSTAMLRGDFEAAWRISDAVLKSRHAASTPCWHLPRHQQWIWDGRPLIGRHVLVRCYHGLGDTLQFLRFMRPLREIARRVTVWIQPQLAALAATVAGIDAIEILNDGAPATSYDVDIEIMELAHALRSTRQDVGAAVPYVRVPHARAPRRCPDTLHVGLVWNAGEWNPARSIDPRAFSRLSLLAGVRLYALQYPCVGEHTTMLNADELSCRDIMQMAARLQQLDLLVTVDTMAAHLAGAMGLRVWTLLPTNCDWRWLKAGEHTPWYPTMRLFRQRNAGDWTAVIDDVWRELAAWE